MTRTTPTPMSILLMVERGKCCEFFAGDVFLESVLFLCKVLLNVVRDRQGLQKVLVSRGIGFSCFEPRCFAIILP